MHIELSPVRMDETLTIEREGDVLLINGERFDFGPLPEGGALPAAAIASNWFAGPVERIDGELHLSITVPHGANAPQETRFPAPLDVMSNGAVQLPAYNIEPDPAPPMQLEPDIQKEAAADE